MNFYYAGKSDVGLVRSNNEDFFAAERLGPDEYLFVVADGMGGHLAGEVASRIAVETFLQAVKRAPQEGLPDFFRKLVNEINSTIVRMAESDPSKKGMGTTLSALYIKGNKAYIVHVGDSRIYRLHRGKLEQLTEDHSVVERMVRDGLITPSQALTHPKRNVLYQSLGMKKGVEPQILGPITVDEDTTFLLCTDGLSNLVQDREKQYYMELHPAKAVEGLVELARRRGAPDNVTVIVVTNQERAEETTAEEAPALSRLSRRTRLLLALSLVVLAVFTSLLVLLGKKSNEEIAPVKKRVAAPSYNWLKWRFFLRPSGKWLLCDEGLIFKKDNKWWFKDFSGESKVLSLPSEAEVVPSPAIAWKKGKTLYWRRASEKRIHRLKLSSGRLVYFVPPSTTIYDTGDNLQVMARRSLLLPSVAVTFFYGDKAIFYNHGVIIYYDFSSLKSQETPVSLRGEDFIFIHRSSTGEFVIWKRNRIIKGKVEFRPRDEKGSPLEFVKVAATGDLHYFVAQAIDGNIYLREGEI